jgi:hypothetical protein
VPRPNIDENEPDEVQIEKWNNVRIDIIKRHYGQQQVGKELLQVSHYWDILEMQVNLIVSKPNIVQGKKNYFLLFINSKYSYEYNIL